MALVLFGTEACHLCEDAQALIISIQTQITSDVFVEDIAFEQAHFERYGLRIPVLLNEVSGAELDWPFDQAQLVQWLSAQGVLK